MASFLERYLMTRSKPAQSQSQQDLPQVQELSQQGYKDSKPMALSLAFVDLEQCPGQALAGRDFVRLEVLANVRSADELAAYEPAISNASGACLTEQLAV